MKKVTWIMILALIISSLTGCNPAQKALIDDMNKVLDGQFFEVSLRGKLVYEQVEAYYNIGEKSSTTSMTFNLNAYVDLENEKAHFVLEGKESDTNKLERIEGYINGEKLIADRNYFLLNYPSRHYDKLGSDYISIDLPYSMSTFFSDIRDGKKSVVQLLELLDEETVDFPIKQAGNTYTIKLDDEGISQSSMTFLKAIFSKPSEVYDILEKVLPEDSYTMSYERNSKKIDSSTRKGNFIKNINKYFGDGELYEIGYYFLRGTLYGSSCEAKATFENNTATLDLKGKVDYLANSTTTFDVQLKVSKVEKQELNLPSDIYVIQ